MCSILGMGIFQHSKINKQTMAMFKDIFKNMFVAAESGGRDAAGCSAAINGKIEVVKNNMPAGDFVNTETYKNFADKYFGDKIGDPVPYSILGHCRWQTKGTYMDNNNNHPIVSENMIGVHNGHIHNDESLYIKHGVGILGRLGKVDSEVIFRLINHYHLTGRRTRKSEPVSIAIEKSARELQGSFACAMQSAIDPHMLWLFRNNNPAKIRYYSRIGLLLFATSVSFISTAVRDYDLGPHEDIEVEDGIEFNLKENTLFKFNLA